MPADRLPYIHPERERSHIDRDKRRRKARRQQVPPWERGTEPDPDYGDRYGDRYGGYSREDAYKYSDYRPRHYGYPSPGSEHFNEPLSPIWPRRYYGDRRQIRDADYLTRGNPPAEGPALAEDDSGRHSWQGRHFGKGPKGYTRNDNRIFEDVNDRLTEDTEVDASAIQVSVRQGEVTLEGAVADRAAKRRAEDCADHVKGVRHVQNNLRIERAS